MNKNSAADCETAHCSVKKYHFPSSFQTNHLFFNPIKETQKRLLRQKNDGNNAFPSHFGNEKKATWHGLSHIVLILITYRSYLYTGYKNIMGNTCFGSC